MVHSLVSGLRGRGDKSLTWETETTQLKSDIKSLKWETQTNNETTLEWEKTGLPSLFSSGERENSDNSLKWVTAEHETKDTVTVPENRSRMDRRSQTRPAETRRVDGSFTVHNGRQTEKNNKSSVGEGGKTTRVVLRVHGGQSMQRRQVSRLEDSRGYSKRNDGHNEGSVTG